MWRHAIWIAALLGSCFIAYNVTASHNPAVSGPRQSIAARTTPNNTANSAPVNPAPNDNVAVNISVDYGAQMLLLDAQSRRTGYDRNTGQVLSNLPEAAYVDDSISDAADDSDDAAAAESRVLTVHPKAGQRYSLKILPTDRNAYDLELLCTGDNGSSLHISAPGIRISPSEEHSFVMATNPGCSNLLLTGAFHQNNDTELPLLSYAYPSSGAIRLKAGELFHLVLIYDSRVNPSSFSAKLNDKTITDLFHPKRNTIESVTIPVMQGTNKITLNVAGTSRANTQITTLDSFAVDVD